MTAPPAAAPPFRKIPIFLKFPPEHWLAGMTVERGRLCGCNQRFFQQQLVNPEYLDSLRGMQGKLFVDECCVIEKKSDTQFRIWTPARCPVCERARMNTPSQPRLEDNTEERYR